MTTEIVRDDEEVVSWIVRFNVLEEVDIIPGIASGGTAG